MGTVKPDAKIAEWRNLFKQSLRDASSQKRFRIEVSRLSSTCPFDGLGVLEAWVKSHDGGFTVRARLTRYLGQLLYSGYVTDVDGLDHLNATVENTILRQDEYIVRSGAAKGEFRQCTDAVILDQLSYHMIRYRATSVNVNQRVQSMRTYKPLLHFMITFTRVASSLSILNGPCLSIGNELARYAIAYVKELHTIGMLGGEDGSLPQVLKKGLGRALSDLAAVLSNSSTEVAESLTTVQREARLFGSSDMEQLHGHLANDLDAMTYQQNIIDTPLVTTRAALYIYLNAMLAGRPLCDDPALFTYLNTRYSGTVDVLIADLITASFDVLANAINRTEPSESINVYRSFLINKLPVLLVSFSDMLFPPTTTESCITGALHRMDPSTDPFSNQSFDLLSSSGMLSDARQDFLFACALHDLIPESSIETILGDVPMQSLPDGGRYDRGTLVSQCETNSNRVEELVRELENMEGNSSEVAGALVQIIETLCTGKDSVTLKGVCNALLRKTQALDVLLLFTPAANVLQPLCDFLDNWQDMEEQSESHPVYDEFGSIFLLVLVFRQHFNLSLPDFNIGQPDSFIRAYVNNGCTPLEANSLSESQKEKLGGWVKSLFDSDGISDELMSTCPPKQFHLLVATLFDQTLKATQSGVLAMDTIKGGLEYLLEPFLLASLVTALGWAARVLWSTRNPAPHLEHLLPILTGLIRPQSLSPDATAMHEAVLSVAARPLERALAHVQKLHPRRQDIDPLLNTLKARVQPSRAATTSHNELETWSTASGHGGYPASIRQTLQVLVTWSATGSLQSAPPNYTHRQILMGVQMLGAPTVLTALLDEAILLLDRGSALEVVLDIVSALICAPVAAQGRATMSLRNALSPTHADAFAVSKIDPARAEFIVKLQRRVETQAPQKVESQSQLPADANTAMMMDTTGDIAGNQVAGDTVDLERIMKGVQGDIASGNFDMDNGADADMNDLFGL